jgi:CheY-like chemotaxis protein
MAHVLIVEDEPHIRLLTCTLLQQLGHTVMEAENGIVALHILDHNPQIEMVITDIQLPELDGVELVEAIKTKYPHLRVVVSSIYRYRMAEAQKKGADIALKKPYSRQQFLESIRRTLVVRPRIYPVTVAG